MNRSLKAAVAAVIIGSATLASPALAGGSISISIAPGNAKQEKAMRLGLGIYALANGFKNGGIKQKGFGNMAGLSQNGGGNLGVVHQEGNGHTGTVEQNGSGNAYGLFQFGNNAEGHVVQNGNGGTGATFQLGW